ncbi:spermidine/putrescine ABC transporter substrate-binding protein [Vibrio sp. JPW-9-11-11]|uniref:polyamine ABC transporter substrate-binding protein n=1 Tax=Vibrio sp. JPW-9-11-11 TaxID=1416532 RepID=UPI001592C89B|nr:spermidine/putrescine ABC transporter substrate-binding protein [Vibrio sp. JPW-9-11-11]NVD05792.1 spermidine/putrescine ABC transporter substrate-binding protein [Vibrio sp. JPW-9-11-11]
MRTSLLFLLFIHSCAALATPTSLKVYMWEDTLASDVKQQWQTETGVDLTLSHFDNDDERSLLMMKNPQLPFDVVVLDNVSAKIYGRLGAFEEISNLQGRQNNAPQWNQACGNYAIPYFWGTVGIAYRKAAVEKPPKTWQEFVAPPEALRGKIGMINDSTETFLPVLYGLGLSPTTDDIEQLKRAYPELLAFSDHILTYDYILSYVRSGDASELDMALAYSGDQYSLNRFYQKEGWDFVVPQGELFVWVDCLAVSRHSENKRLAKDFLEFMMRPHVAASNAINIKAATPNVSAMKLLPDGYVNDASLFPATERIKNARVDSELSADNIGIRTKIINQLLKRHEAKH